MVAEVVPTPRTGERRDRAEIESFEVLTTDRDNQNPGLAPGPDGADKSILRIIIIYHNENICNISNNNYNAHKSTSDIQ